MVVVYLALASMNHLAPVASRVIRWASAWNRPVLSAVTMVCLMWTWRGQAQWMWVSAHALVHRHALHPRPAIVGPSCAYQTVVSVPVAIATEQHPSNDKACKANLRSR